MHVRPGTGLLRHVEQSIRDRSLFRERQRVLVAVSGGLDSIVLLRVLHALAPGHRWSLVVAHFNHQLRGAASAADERFVRAQASALGLPFVSGRWPKEQHHRAREFGLEMAARLDRHKFLAGAAAARRCSAIALAHHADDQVELFFLRLLRGAGGEGLGGMKWKSRGWMGKGLSLVRPFLDQSREQLTACARAQGFRHREDATNLDLDRDRNWIRHELLPRLTRRFGRTPLATVLRTMDLVGADAEFAQQAAAQWLNKSGSRKFAQLHPAVQREALRLQLRELGVAAEFEFIEQLRKRPNHPVTAEGGGQWWRGANGRVCRREMRQAGFEPGEVRLTLSDSGSQAFGGVEIHWRLAPAGRISRRPHKAGRELFDATTIGPAIRLRHWQPGDRFRPIGLGHALKLQDLFTNLKIPAARRRTVLVAEAAGGEIFWVEGVRIGEKFKLTSRTRRLLEWRWRRGSSAKRVVAHRSAKWSGPELR